MARVLVTTLVLLAISLPAFADTILFAGDSRNDVHGILPAIVQQANTIKGLKCFVYLGDMTGGGSDAEFAAYKKIVATLKIPLYAIPGNHERVASSDKYEKLLGKAYFTKQFGKWRILFIDNSRSTLGAEQLAWIKKQLADASAAKDYIVLAMHKPLWCPPAGNHIMEDADRNTLLDLAKQYKVKLVVGAHYHSYYKGEKDGIVHLTTGGAGAPQPGGLKFFHYVLIDFKDNGTFTTKAVPVRGK